MRPPLSKETSTRHKEALRILQTAVTEQWPFDRTFTELKRLHLTRYEVDSVSGRLTFFWSDGAETVREHEGVSKRTVGREFSAKGVKDAIAQSRKKLVSYDGFLDLICAAGCTSYETNFQSDQVVYYGVNENNKVAEKVFNN